MVSNKTNNGENTENNIVLFNEAHVNIVNKLSYYKIVVQKTILSTQNLKKINILSANDIKLAHSTLHSVYNKISDLEISINLPDYDNEVVINNLQLITNDLSSIIKNYGTQSITDMLNICFGINYIKEYIECLDNNLKDKYSTINKFCTPFSYKLISWAEDCSNEAPLVKNKIIEDIQYATTASTLEGFDLTRSNDNFNIKVYGAKFVFKNVAEKKTLIINTLVQDILIECCSSDYLNGQYSELIALQQDDSIKDKKAYENFCSFLSIKDFLIYNSGELKQQFINHIIQIDLIKQKTIVQLTREFLNDDLYYQRNTIFQLLIKSHYPEFQYLAYLLYDLLTNDSNDNIDTYDQITLFDSLSWHLQSFFRNAMKETINYTNNLSMFDSSQIPLEQQICLLKADESVKAKAMVKLKEVKSKSEDSGAKARQYLESLLKIPFGIYKNEPILSIMTQSSYEFNSLVNTLTSASIDISSFPIKSVYSSVEARKYSEFIKNQYISELKEKNSNNLKQALLLQSRPQLITSINNINTFIKINNLAYPKILQSGKKISYMKENISKFIDHFKNDTKLITNLAKLCNKPQIISNFVPEITDKIDTIDNNITIVNNYMTTVKETLDKSVFGHDKAKRQIERIIGQWINGDNSGYCFGFEGPPGVGKTSLAKNGISQCLKDDSNNSRPFAFIAIGGSSNSSTLDGHNYTYVGSTWGRIVDILMETKCMNPIIFIDELDKISKTENGKEIIGILTHLIDPTQNDTFQDKYFSGIDLDLSRALFIFSYNDVQSLDRILLDRIHRVKFDYLTMQDKLIITKTYLLPEIFSKMGLQDIILINDNVIEYVITEYTCEPGVRKLKEILFEIIGEINLSILQNSIKYELPISISIDDIKNNYLKNNIEVKEKKIHTTPQIGVISGLWANSMGQGGILPIECSWSPANNKLDLRLTGMQGDVMKESMAVAKTIATNLALKYNNGEILKENLDNNTHLTGLHIHVPEGSTPKDGPSAGAAITSTLYSRLTNRKIKNDVAMTGEICLQGNVTAIGGLDLKILGAIRAGVKTVLYPKENHRDFVEIQEKNKDNNILDNIEFHEVSTIHEVFEIIFC